MNIATARKDNIRIPRTVLDTNVVVSAIAYGGVPAKALRLVLDGAVIGVTSDILVSEAMEALRKKIGFSNKRTEAFRRMLRRNFRTVHPARKLSVLRDDPDNRVLEAAIEGKCNYIITGDKELLKLGSYRTISITTPRQFLRDYTSNGS